MILDSGARREFQSGAVRDVTEGKGRCDLLPLDVVAELMGDNGDGILTALNNFVRSRETPQLFVALYLFARYKEWSVEEMLLEVSKHFEEGAKKYDERNWEKGIPLHCYLDSAVRHFLKCRGGWTDERHDRAFVWNVMCMWWTFLHKPELDDLPKEAKE